MDSLEKRLTPPLFDHRLKRQKSYHSLKMASPRSHIQYPSYSLFKTLIFSLFKLAGLYQYARKEANSIEVIYHNFKLASEFKALNDLRILQLSDLHLDINKDLSSIITQTIAPLKYDFAVITGDFFEHHSRNKGIASSQFKNIVQSIPKPIYGILGNHDYIELVPFLEEQGIQMLLNEVTLIPHKKTHLALAGIDDPYYYRTHDLEKTAGLIPPNTASLLLAHSPEVFFQAHQLGFNMMLSGHTHGGQICLPGGIPVINNSRSPRYMISGPWQYKSLQGYTSQGTGCNVLPLRLFCKPEITLHTLSSE